MKIFRILFPCFLLIHSMGFQLGDITNIGRFVSHAQEHRIEYGHNFFQFVMMHYVDATQHAERHDNQHEKLPFHHLSVDSHQIKIVDFTELSHFGTINCFVKKFGLPIDEFYSFISYFSLLQPPQ